MKNIVDKCNNQASLSTIHTVTQLNGKTQENESIPWACYGYVTAASKLYFISHKILYGQVQF